MSGSFNRFFQSPSSFFKFLWIDGIHPLSSLLLFDPAIGSAMPPVASFRGERAHHQSGREKSEPEKLAIELSAVARDGEGGRRVHRKQASDRRTTWRVWQVGGFSLQSIIAAEGVELAIGPDDVGAAAVDAVVVPCSSIHEGFDEEAVGILFPKLELFEDVA